MRKHLPLVGTAAALVFSRVFGLAVVLPNFRAHYDGLGFAALWIGIALGAHGLTMALAQWPSGKLSDRIGRRPLLLAATVLFVAGSLLAAISNTPTTLIAARLLQGLGAVASVAMAAVGEAVPGEKRTTAMALVGIPAGGGFLVGTIVGPLLYPIVGMEGLFVLVAAVGLLAGLPVLGVQFAPHEARPAAAMTAPVFALAFVGFVSNYTLMTTMFFLPFSGTRLVWILLVALLAMLVVSRAIDKRGWTWQPIAAGVLVLPIAAGAFFLAGGPGALVGGALFFAVHSILSAAVPSQVSRAAGAAGGSGHGTQNVVAYVGSFAGGGVAGALALEPMLAALIAVGLGALAASWIRPQRS